MASLSRLACDTSLWLARTAQSGWRWLSLGERSQFFTPCSGLSSIVLRCYSGAFCAAMCGYWAVHRIGQDGLTNTSAPLTVSRRHPPSDFGSRIRRRAQLRLWRWDRRRSISNAIGFMSIGSGTSADRRLGGCASRPRALPGGSAFAFLAGVFCLGHETGWKMPKIFQPGRHRPAGG